MFRLMVVAWLFCPLLGADVAVLVSLGRSAAALDPFLGLASLIFAGPLVLAHYGLARWAKAR